MATNQADSDYPAMRERPPVDPHTYRYILPPPYPDNPEAMQKYNDVNQFRTRLNAIFENDDPAIRARLEQVAQVLRELEQVAQALEDMYALSPEVEAIALPLASQMRESITWGKAQLETAMDRITSALQTLKIDAIPGAKQRPGHSKGGKARSNNIRDIRHAQWQRDAEALVNDVRSGKHKKISTSPYNISRRLEAKYKVEYREACTLREQGKKKDQDVEEKQRYLASYHTIRKALRKTW